MADVLDRWAHARVQTFELSSGLKVEVEILDMRECLRYGRVPNPLASIAQQVDVGSVDPVKMTEDERNEFFDFRNWVVADGVKAVIDKDGKREDVTLGPEWVGKSMPPVDRELIWNYRIHLYKPEEAAQLLTLLDAVTFPDKPASNGNRSSRRAKGAAAK